MGDVQFDDEGGEGDTMVVERERDLALRAQAREAIAEIDDALARLTEGHVRLLGAVRAPDPEGTPRGDSVGDGARRGEGRRHRPAMTRWISPPAPTGRSRRAADRCGRCRGRRRSTSSPSGGRCARSTTATSTSFWTLRFHLSYNSGMAFSRGAGLGPVIGVARAGDRRRAAAVAAAQREPADRRRRRSHHRRGDRQRHRSAVPVAGLAPRWRGRLHRLPVVPDLQRRRHGDHDRRRAAGDPDELWLGRPHAATVRRRHRTSRRRDRRERAGRARRANGSTGSSRSCSTSAARRRRR